MFEGVPTNRPVPTHSAWEAPAEGKVWVGWNRGCKSDTKRMDFRDLSHFPHLPQLPLKRFVIQRSWTKRIKNSYNTRNNEKEWYDSGLKMLQQVVGIKEGHT